MSLAPPHKDGEWGLMGEEYETFQWRLYDQKLNFHIILKRTSDSFKLYTHCFKDTVDNANIARVRGV